MTAERAVGERRCVEKCVPRHAEFLIVSNFVLEGIDLETNSIARDLVFEAEAARLESLLDIDVQELQLGASWLIESDHLELLNSEFGATFDAGPLEVWLRAWRPIDGLTYKVHTNRELLMMLERRKPLAVFDVGPTRDADEEHFAQHVAIGRFIQHQQDGTDGRRQVFYALPGEEWRIDAYIDLCKQAAQSGWSEGFERRQGQLLGYEDWQIEMYIETIYRPSSER
jgi:hypothetical protein